MFTRIALLALLLATPALAQTPAPTLYLDELGVSRMDQGWGVARAKRSMGNNALRIAGKKYERGVGTHSPSEFIVDLKKAATRFRATVGIDDEARGQKGATATFEVYVDGKKKFESPIMRFGQPPQDVSVDLRNASELRLIVTDAGDWVEWDHADWANAALDILADAKDKPAAVAMADEPAMPVAPPNGATAIHGPRIVGATPGRPFVLLIPATGETPLTYSARNLPAGLVLDSASGIISGAIKAPGETVATLSVDSKGGVASRKLKFVAGPNKLALTPPMGWNSWNAYEGNVDEDKMRAAADAVVSLGLAARGFQYINIDDGWAGDRDGQGSIRPNSKFESIRKLAADVHAKGLRLGIYSGPGRTTAQGLRGSFEHEADDVKTWASWDIDYLKYDWTSYESIAKDHSLPALQAPYQRMQKALAAADRDIVYSLCQYGWGKVWTWGPNVNGNLWRTTGDIFDSWSSISAIANVHANIADFSGPGHWNDADMLVLGRINLWGGPHATRLKPNEQIFHMSMWCMFASPLMIGCDLKQMDDFTLSLLSNTEVLDIDQDPLGKAARRVAAENGMEIWSRPLWDGTTAVALVNRNPREATVKVTWAQLTLPANQPVRDLWQRKDLGVQAGGYQAAVAGHGAVLLKVGKANRTDWP